MAHRLQPLIIALQLLTRIPTPPLADITPKQFATSVLYYPAVGLIIGLLLLLTNWIFSDTPVQTAAALLLIVWVAITGALHIDGLADSADAWIGGYGNPQRTLEIMKDPCSGPAAVSAIVLLLIAKYAALQAILKSESLLILLVAPLLSRAFILPLLLSTPYVRENGLASSWIEQLSHQQAWSVFAGSALLILILLGWSGLLILLSCAIFFMCLRAWMIQRIGGTTGDTTGALVEILELVILLSFVSLAL